jgi:TatA/E family protein of Tat protein translocase
MQAIAENGLMFALFNLGGGEIILILAGVVILIGAKKIPELARGLGQGLSSFRNAADDVVRAIDDEASEAGRSVGGVYGKHAAQALTPGNRVAELYDPAAFQKEPQSQRRPKSLWRFFKNLWRRAIEFLAKIRTRT